jgi:hypothetical protein
MSFSREYAHRPPIPTAEEILEDFNSVKNKDLVDPVFVLSENFPTITERGMLPFNIGKYGLIFFVLKVVFPLSTTHHFKL